jgi:conjugative relaxase-like TrwC/TraI family protein
VLSIGKLGAGASAADYYLRRQAGCDVDYYTGDGERAGVWCGSGARALGLEGPLTEQGERTLRALLAGETADGQRLVAPVMRADPRSKVPALEVVDAVRRQLAGRELGTVTGGDEKLVAAFDKAVRAVERSQRRAVWPAPAMPADVAGRLLSAVGLDPARVLRSPSGRNRYVAAVRRLGSRVDVRLSGLDFTLSAPKSVTLLWALGSPEVAGEVRAAHDSAVTAAVEYMERACGGGLRGHHGRGHRYVDTDGLIGVAFEHRTSREDDPQLHTHVVVANLLRGVDGKWGAVNTREAFRHARTGGFVYQAVLRGELTARLGVGWARVRKGQADVEEIPTNLMALFSKRRAAIAAQLDLFGRDDPSAARAATLATRPDKTGVDGESLRDRWRRQARDAGFGDDVDVALHRYEPPAVDVDAVVASLLAPDGLTSGRSTFDRRDVMRAVCEALPAGAAVTLTQLREIATRVVRDRATVPVVTDTAPAERKYSTAELLQVEQSARDVSLYRLDDAVAVVDKRAVASVLSGAGLSREQAAMVRRVTTSGAGVEVVVGPAGSGKTRALAAARLAWEAAGVPVTGAAVAAIAARVLEDGAGIRASSLTRLLADVHRVDPTTGRECGLPVGGVLVVDEAGMVGTRMTGQLIELTERYSTKLVLVGDPHQLPEIEAGGLFADLVDTLPAARLVGNRRQRAGWERAALAELRDGDVHTAVASYAKHGRVRIADNGEELNSRLLEDYRSLRATSGPGQVLVVASSRADARRLNRVLRAALVDDGTLGPDELEVAVGDNGSTRGYRAGDEVVVTSNDYRRALLNGTRGQVSAVDIYAGTVTVRLGDGRDVTLGRRYLRTGRLAHAYALTAHKAQGMTVEVALLWGSAALTREIGYVAMSRGRAANYLYSTWDQLRRDFSGEIDRPRVEEQPSPRQRAALDRAALVDRLSSSGRQKLARSWWRPADREPVDAAVSSQARQSEAFPA